LPRNFKGFFLASVLAFVAPVIALAASVARADEPSPPPAPAPLARAPAGGDVTPPHLLAPIAVQYPPGATGAASVVLRITVDKDGRIREASVVDGSEPFASAALASVDGARFEPAMRAGQPVAATVRFRIDFTPPPPPAPEPPPSQQSSTTTPSAAATPVAPAPPVVEDVNVRGLKLDPGAQELGHAEIRQLPGAFGDPFRAIEMLPGVTPIISGIPYYYVRGSPPSNVGYFIDGVRVPYLFHFGAGPAVLHPSLIDRLELYSGAYPAEFGRFAGGIVATDTRAPKEGLHGEANIRFVDAGAIVDAPFDGGRGAVIVAGRFSYTAALLSLISPGTSIDYRDYQAEVLYHLTPRDTVSLLTFGAFDLASDTENGNKVTLFGSEFYRADLRYDHALDGGGSLRIATAVGLDRSRIPGTGARFAQDVLIQPRAALRLPLGPHLTLRAGVDGAFDVIHGDLPPRYSESDSAYADDLAFYESRLDTAIGAYADVVAKVTPALEVTPGVRVDNYTSGSVQALAVDPRLSSRLTVAPHVRLVQAFGLAHQPPAFPIPVPALTIGYLQGGLQETVQTSAGVEADLPWDVKGSAIGFHNAFFHMNDAFGTPTGTSNDSNGPFGNALSRVKGSAYGLELSARRSLAKGIGGFVSYTLSRSERTTDLMRPSGFDRTHVLNVAASVDMGKGWLGGARLLFYTGEPTYLGTPANQPSTTPQPPPRYPPFWRLDLRLEKRWNVGRGGGHMSLVIETLNTTLNKEVLGYDCGGTTCTPNAVGPIAIPSVGVEGGF
jgi:TonB family protein